MGNFQEKERHLPLQNEAEDIDSQAANSLDKQTASKLGTAKIQQQVATAGQPIWSP